MTIYATDLKRNHAFSYGGSYWSVGIASTDFFYTHMATIKKNGRPLATTPENLLQTFEAYRKHIKDNNKKVNVVAKGEVVTLSKERPLTVVGFCVFANIGLSTFREYKTREEFSAVYARIRQTIDTDQTEGAMLEVYNPTITSKLLGLTEKTDITTDGEKINAVPSPIIAYYGSEKIELTSDDIDGRE